MGLWGLGLLKDHLGKGRQWENLEHLRMTCHRSHRLKSQPGQRYL
ncbi:hypothetical protein GCM10010298_76940 [Streptomyces microflavus]|uniref:Uncharacterized protein n=1 Tax=Streptomyces termitum TaxID=67368 RepID=A0A918TB81_9ACTN|nr:hypothetical protein GCM10010298_76940 [Streptomyces microflavus]GGZ31517.1 hypothetical protein GCM10010300_87060 [Streptomyces olivaceoviridis]GHB12177.1 hypothetical protein GCM10010305_63180 [Streptomyces termitum]